MTCLWLVYTLNRVGVRLCRFCADHGFSLCCQKIEMYFDTQAACADEALGVVQYCYINEIQLYKTSTNLSFNFTDKLLFGSSLRNFCGARHLSHCAVTAETQAHLKDEQVV